MDKWFEEASEIATWAARTTHRKYNTYFDIEDVKNEMIVWMLNHEKKIQSWLETDDEERKALEKIMEKPIHVGQDGVDAQHAVSSIFNNESLEDELKKLADVEGPDADARQTIINWMKGNGMKIVAGEIEAKLQQGGEAQTPPAPPAPTDGPGNIELVYCRWVNSSKMGFTPLGLTALGQAENKQDAKNKVVAALAAQSIMDPVMNKPAPQGPITRVSYRKTKNGNFCSIIKCYAKGYPMDLKIKDVAELLNVSETTIRRWL